jgi:hypothetical protein
VQVPIDESLVPFVETHSDVFHVSNREVEVTFCEYFMESRSIGKET